MSTLAASEPASEQACGQKHFLLRRLHSLTGILFGGYLIVHLLVNATLAEGPGRDGGPSIYQVQVDKIHSLPFLWAVEWVLIFIPIIYHTIYGLWITYTGQPNVGSYPYAKNIFYLMQRLSAILIAAFLVFHVLGTRGLFGSTLKFDAHNAVVTVARNVNASFFIAWVVYPLGVLVSCYHLANGFFTAAITWGLTISAAAQKRWGYLCGGLFVFTLACGLLAWGWLLAHPTGN